MVLKYCQFIKVSNNWLTTVREKTKKQQQRVVVDQAHIQHQEWNEKRMLRFSKRYDEKTLPEASEAKLQNQQTAECIAEALRTMQRNNNLKSFIAK